MDGGCGWENADRKMRMKKKTADNKKSKKKKKTRNADNKIKK